MKIIESFYLLNIKERVLLIIIVLLLLLLLVSLGSIANTITRVQNFNQDIDNSFDGVKWGDAIENYPDLIKFVAYENDNVVTYYKSRDISPLKSVEPDEVTYVFQDGKFRAAAAFSSKGESTLLYEMVDQYGSPLFSILRAIAIRTRICSPLSFRYHWNYAAVRISYRPASRHFIAIFDYRSRKEAAYDLQWFVRPGFWL